MNITGFFEYFAITLPALLVIVNPLTSAFIFVSLLPRASDATIKGTARRSATIAFCIFVTFALLGGVIFTLFGITLEAFRIAGGLILFGIAMGMIRRGEDEAEEATSDDSGKVANDISVIPLAIPFISGPGSIATVMILTSEAPSIWHLSVVFVSIFLVVLACYFAMRYSHFLVKFLGETGKEIITRVFGIILAVLAVQFVINGVLEIYRGL